MSEEQRKGLVNIIFQNKTPLHTSLDKLAIVIKDNNDWSNNIMKETNDLKLSIETHQNVADDKVKDTQLTKSKKQLGEKLKNWKRVAMILTVK